MPTLSMFFGLIIRMYYGPKEHNPPHIHVYYGEFTATVKIEDCEIAGREITCKTIKVGGSMDRNTPGRINCRLGIVPEW